VLQAYIDASRAGSNAVFAMAGYISTVELWKQFSHAWRGALDGGGQRNKLPYFKMKEMRRDIERCSDFYKIIEENTLVALSCTVPCKPLAEIVEQAWWNPYIKDAHKLTNPYYLAFKTVMDMVSLNRTRMALDEPIDFVFDTDLEKWGALNAWYVYGDHAAGAAPIFRDDDKVVALQAADLLAYWVGQWAVEEKQDGEWHFPWQTSREVPWLSIDYTEETIADVLEQLLGPLAYKHRWSQGEIREWVPEKK
jgi:hypothetical protein